MDQQFSIKLEIQQNPGICTGLVFEFKLRTDAKYMDFEIKIMQIIREKLPNLHKIRMVSLERSIFGKLLISLWYQPDSYDVDRFNVEELTQNWPDQFQDTWTFSSFIENWLTFEKNCISINVEIASYTCKYPSICISGTKYHRHEFPVFKFKLDSNASYDEFNTIMALELEKTMENVDKAEIMAVLHQLR